MNKSDPDVVSRWSQILSDLRFLAGVLVICGTIGLALNCLRPRPLALWGPEASARSLEQANTDRLASKGGASQQIDLEAALSILQRKAAIFVDARDKAFFDLGHIPGALSLPRGTFDSLYPEFGRATKKDAPIIVYCSEADCKDSTIVASELINHGYTSVKVFPGGWGEWSAAGLPKEP